MPAGMLFGALLDIFTALYQQPDNFFDQ